MEIPELAELIWLFEDEPQGAYEDVQWPVGLHSFQLTRGAISVLYSIDPTAAEAYISRLRPLGGCRLSACGPATKG